MVQPTELLFLVGRVILGLFFAWSGVKHFRDLAALGGYAASKGVPAPRLAIAATGLLLLVGGLSVAAGILPRLGLALLAVFLIGTTPVMHAYWKAEDPMTRMGESINFSKNVALLGAVLALAIVPTPWALGLVSGL